MTEIKSSAVETDSARFSRALRSAILWPACVILFTAILMLASIITLMRVVKWSEHSYAVIAESRDCEGAVLDAQSDVRGYLLRVDRDFPAAFHGREQKVNQLFDKLALLVRDNPEQKIRVEALTAEKNLWFARAQTLLKGRVPGAEENADWVKSGDDLIDDLRTKFRALIEEEEQSHQERLERVNAIKRGAGFAGGGLAVVLAAAAALLVRRPFMELAGDYRTALHTVEQRHDELVRSEADLEAQKEWFRVTLTSIRDGVIVTDQEKRVVFMNHESERLTGWKNVEALLKPLPSVFRIVDEKSRQPLGDPAGRALEGKMASSPSGLAVLLSHSGDEWPIEESSSPIQDAKGKILGVVLVFRNATEKRKAQAALQSHSAELEKSVEERTTALRQSVTELETFSYTVSHDLRSPLRAMQGFAQAVLEDYGDKLDDQGKDYLQRIKKAAERLDRLIQDLLSYTRISRQSVKTQPIDTDQFLRELVENYPNLHPPAAEVVIEGSLPRVLANEATLTQIFSNLLGNAVKFVPPGVLPHIRVWGEDQGAKARIWIEDNGIGIDPVDYDRIFQMFVQVHEAQAFGGTGVGLSIVKKATESMQGRVGLVSTPKEGSRFWVELPKAA